MARFRELTPRGRGGISVLELTGPGVLELLARRLAAGAEATVTRAEATVTRTEATVTRTEATVTRTEATVTRAEATGVRAEATGGVLLAPGRLVLARLAFGGEELDEALVWCDSPSRAELHLHGSPPLVRRVEAELLRAGFEAWSEDSPRTIEERARDLLPRAQSRAGARMLLDQAEGALRAELAHARLLTGDALRARLELLALRGRRARYLLDGVRVVLAGVVNAGKSTLFNALVGSERALVTPEAGTTRDVVSERASLGEWPAVIFDTAGLRALAPEGLEAEVEARGQELGRRARQTADVVLWLVPADAPSSPGPPGPRGSLTVVTRTDLASPAAARRADAVRVQAGPDPHGAAEAVAVAVRAALELPERAFEPGAGVPFEPWMVGALEACLTGPPGRLPDAAALDALAAPR